MSTAAVVGFLAAVVLLLAVGGGALLATLALRIHPRLSFRRLWLFYSALLAVTTSVVLAIAWW